MKRLFFALCPDEITREQCVKIKNELCIGKVNAVPEDNIHVTLLFLGNIDSDKESMINRESASINVPNIRLCFNNLSFWKKFGILCLTATVSSPELEKLVEDLSKLASKLDIPINERPFTPHVTLVKKALRQQNLEFDPVIWHSNAFCLVESCQVSSGVEYRIVQKWEAKNKRKWMHDVCFQNVNSDI
jgi:RNA 2',3'-cyclic 3'-phosphodiesterase